MEFRRGRRKFIFEHWMDVNIEILRKGERLFYDYIPTKSNQQKGIKFSWLEKKKYGYGFEKWLEKVEMGKFQISSHGNVRTFTEWRDGKLQDLVTPKLLTKYTYKTRYETYLYVFLNFQEVNVLHLLTTHFSSLTICRTENLNFIDLIITTKNGNYRDLGLRNIKYFGIFKRNSFLTDDRDDTDNFIRF